MKRFAIAMLLAAFSCSAAAGWVKVGHNDTSTAYADPATIRKARDMVKMWSVIDYKTAKVSNSGKPYMSLRAQFEYDCKEEQSRILYTSFHSANMVSGEIVFMNDNPGKWGPVPPGTGDEILLKIACGKE